MREWDNWVRKQAVNAILSVKHTHTHIQVWLRNEMESERTDPFAACVCLGFSH